MRNSDNPLACFTQKFKVMDNLGILYTSVSRHHKLLLMYDRAAANFYPEIPRDRSASPSDWNRISHRSPFTYKLGENFSF
jgi:hypothetical protein